jgi:hypothetical protein
MLRGNSCITLVPRARDIHLYSRLLSAWIGVFKWLLFLVLFSLDWLRLHALVISSSCFCTLSHFLSHGEHEERLCMGWGSALFESVWWKRCFVIVPVSGRYRTVGGRSKPCRLEQRIMRKISSIHHFPRAHIHIVRYGALI